MTNIRTQDNGHTIIEDETDGSTTLYRLQFIQHTCLYTFIHLEYVFSQYGDILLYTLLSLAKYPHYHLPTLPTLKKPGDPDYLKRKIIGRMVYS